MQIEERLVAGTPDTSLVEPIKEMTEGYVLELDNFSKKVYLHRLDKNLPVISVLETTFLSNLPRTEFADVDIIIS